MVESLPPQPFLENFTSDILTFTPDQLFRNRGDVRHGFNSWIGTSTKVTWPALVKMLSTSRPGDPTFYTDPNDAKKATGAWVMGAYLWGHRRNDNFLVTQLMGFDVDSGNHSLEHVRAAFGHRSCIIHSTYKSTSTCPRWRVIVPLSSPCKDAESYRRVHTTIVDRLVAHAGFGIKDIDKAGKEPSRAWWMPMHHPSQSPVFFSRVGETVDWERIIASLPKVPTRQRVAPRPSTDCGYAAIMSVVRHMDKVEQGQRHNELVKKCLWLRDLGVTAAAVIPILAPAVSSDARHEKKVAQQIRSAMSGPPKPLSPDGAPPLGDYNLGLEVLP